MTKLTIIMNMMAKYVAFKGGVTMKHWKTGEDMGHGYQYNRVEHEKNQYNSLIKVKPYEENTMRTMYLARDVWSNDQLIELRDALNDFIQEDEHLQALRTEQLLKQMRSDYD